MELIASSKVKKAQALYLGGKPIADVMWQVLGDVVSLSAASRISLPLLQRRPVTKIAVVHITPDRGLCGGLDTRINHLTAEFILKQTVPVTVIAIGRQGINFMSRWKRDIRAEFTRLSDQIRFADIRPISRIIIDDYSNGFVDMVYLAYAKFISTFVQKPVLQQILPVEPVGTFQTRSVEFIIEPSPDVVLSGLLPRFVEVQVYHAILESIASVQSARMVAMRNATDSAQDFIDKLTISYNKARQEAITAELLDITAAAVD
jgi:F-type H+-transporting ATPase subunit gamma